MIWENNNFSSLLFKEFDTMKYILKYQLAPLVGVDLLEYGDPEKKQVKDPAHSVSANPEPWAPELDDLSKLHWLVTSRKVITILEFGLGKSTVVFDDALKINQKKDHQLVKKKLRKNNQYECHSIDNHEKWIDEVRNNHVLETVTFHKSRLIMGTFEGRACTYYDPLPNVSPDLIYLDGPDQFSVSGEIRGITTDHKDRMPMAADVLVFEHFLTPGTLIVTDGRTANARFLKANLQRNWCYCHDIAADQHYFELLETPLGVYNAFQIDFCLGTPYFDRLRQANEENQKHQTLLK